ncbi:MAG: homoserine O-acetyltransferase [Microthrixaceae bacterium]
MTPTTPPTPASTSPATTTAAATPVSGAWVPGDPPGRRQFAPVGRGRTLKLEAGGRLSEVMIAYETWGELNAGRTNAVLVPHALTGDSHAAGRAGPAHPTAGWWDAMIGPGRPIDTDRYFVVCPNVLGGCQGTTGPAHPEPGSNRPYGSRFPWVTIRDMVRTQADLAAHLGIDRWHAVVGGSMGGMQALEWAAMYPRRVGRLVALATTAAASAQQIGWSLVGRRAIEVDPNFAGGDYYDRAPGFGPHAGLAVARSVAQITYRSEPAYAQRFGRARLAHRGDLGAPVRYDVESYLDYHGEKLARRFDANSYLRVNRAMDLHDLGRGRNGVAKALRRIQAPTQVISINSDALYPPYQQRDLFEGLCEAGVEAGFRSIDSVEGHDGFLLAVDAIGPIVSDFLDGRPPGGTPDDAAGPGKPT